MHRRCCAEFCCNGTVVDDTELGQVIQLQGDQRKNASTFLVRVHSSPSVLCRPLLFMGFLCIANSSGGVSLAPLSVMRACVQIW